MGNRSGEAYLTPDFWARNPRVASYPPARSWIELLARRRYADRTAFHYAADLDLFLAFIAANDVSPENVGPDDVEAYERHLTTLRPRRVNKVVFLADRRLPSKKTLANSTMNRRMLVPDIWFDYLLAKKVVSENPFTGLLELASGSHRRRMPFRASDDGGSFWIPDGAEWRAIQQVMYSPYCTPRDRFMLFLSYDCALRISELVGLHLDDIYLTSGAEGNYVHVRNGKGARSRKVPFTDALIPFLEAYLEHRAEVSLARGPLFVSESRRNFGEPISAWSWQKRIKHIRDVAGLPRLKSHTMRHLCLTDLARSGEDILYIAAFAGHKSFESTQRYIHLAARDLRRSVATGMGEVREWRSRTMMRAGLSDVG